LPHIVVVGGGIAGLATGLMLTKHGHEVTVLERDSGPVPDTPAQSWESWERTGVMQFRQPHLLHAGGWRIIEEQLPEVARAVRMAGGAPWNRLSWMPRAIGDRASRPGDEKWDAVNARRPVLEHAFAAAAEGRMDVRRGVRVTGLLSDRPRHVSGVRIAPGTGLRADLVIDATGRRSALPGWLAAIGAGQPAEERGFTYYSRFFRTRDGEQAPSFHGDLYTALDSCSILTGPGDAETWSVTVFINSRDQELKSLRAETNWNRLLGACPLHERLLADLEPITDVLPASGIVNRLRELVVDGAPVATGILAVGDSWACTNPSGGRGVTLALLHAATTAETVGEHLGDPVALALAQHRKTSERLLPWYRNSAQIDQARLAQIGRAVEEHLDPATGPSSTGSSSTGPSSTGPSDPVAALMRNFAIGMNWDADVFRAFCEMTAMLALPGEILARPGMTEQISEAAAGRQLPPPPGPSRTELLALLSLPGHPCRLRTPPPAGSSRSARRAAI
jgi:2-polyprenyl-6-methoxyphenol hydroxylase-like FAD-dependent oxidoreductase